MHLWEGEKSMSKFLSEQQSQTRANVWWPNNFVGGPVFSPHWPIYFLIWVISLSVKKIMQKWDFIKVCGDVKQEEPVKFWIQTAFCRNFKMNPLTGCVLWVPLKLFRVFIHKGHLKLVWKSLFPHCCVMLFTLTLVCWSVCIALPSRVKVGWSGRSCSS